MVFAFHVEHSGPVKSRQNCIPQSPGNALQSKSPLLAADMSNGNERQVMVWRIRTSYFLVFVLLLSAARVSWAQTPAPVLRPNQQAPVLTDRAPVLSSTARPDPEKNYRIGPGDVLDIRVFNRPELSGDRRVNEAGRIRLPFIEEFTAACLTEAEIAQQITEKYQKYLRDPQVDVLVKEYKSQPVAVIGAVSNPARFQMQRRVRLLELLTYAGGPTNRAGETIHIIHSDDFDFCAVNLPGKPAAAPGSKSATPSEEPEAGTISILTALSSIKLRDLLSGKIEANVYVQPGDVVSIPEAEQVFVTGAVNRPGAFSLTNKLTLSQAIAQAGGINMEGAQGRVRLIRQDPATDKRTEKVFRLSDIHKNKIEDVTLLPNDIIEVPNSTLRAASRNLLGVSISMLAALPYFIIR